MISYFDSIYGNEQVKKYLSSMVANNKIGNSLLFAGPDGIGKGLFAEALAKMLICSDDPNGLHRQKIESGSHPDIRIYHPEGKIGMHSIETLRQLTEEVYQSPYEAKWKIFIIHDADRMLVYSANALLKTFEEPAQTSIIILLSSSPDSLLSTILSRCRTIRFHAVHAEILTLFLQKSKDLSLEKATQVAALARGSIGNALSHLDDTKDTLREFILNLFIQGKLGTYSKLLEAAGHISAKFDETKKNIEEATKALILSKLPTDLNAHQKQSLEKEVEGAVSTRTTSMLINLFEIILAWYRDLHLLHVKGNCSLLFHPDYQSQENAALQRGDILPIEDVQKALIDAKLAFSRSTSINIVLEKLFLQLNLL